MYTSSHWWNYWLSLAKVEGWHRVPIICWKEDESLLNAAVALIVANLQFEVWWLLEGDGKVVPGLADVVITVDFAIVRKRGEIFLEKEE